MPSVYLSVGSNVDRERNVAAALGNLQARFGQLVVSPVYSCPAVGFDGDDFLNLVVRIETEAPVAEVSAILKALEDAAGRRRDQPRFSARTLDIDILLYGDVVGTVDGVELPRTEILRHAFVLKPLADVAPLLVHPTAGQTMQALWQNFSGRNDLQVVALHWQDA